MIKPNSHSIAQVHGARLPKQLFRSPILEPSQTQPEDAHFHNSLFLLLSVFHYAIPCCATSCGHAFLSSWMASSWYAQLAFSSASCIQTPLVTAMYVFQGNECSHSETMWLTDGLPFKTSQPALLSWLGVQCPRVG